MIKVGLKDLQGLTRRLYLKLEYPEAQTETISDVFRTLIVEEISRVLSKRWRLVLRGLMHNAKLSWRKRLRFPV